MLCTTLRTLRHHFNIKKYYPVRFISINPTREEESLFRFTTAVVNDFGVNNVRVAGGWVRNKLLGKESDDIDFVIDGVSGTTFYELLKKIESRNPFGNIELVRSCPEKSKHLGAVVIRIGQWQIDCMQQRKERYSENSRIPVIEAGTLEDDAFRRDFTMNAMYYNLRSKELEDPTKQGLEDLQNNIIHTVGRAEKKFLEDPLRGLRAVRFMAQYELSLSPSILGALESPIFLEQFYAKVGKSHISAEFRKLVAGPRVIDAIHVLDKTKFLDVILFGTHSRMRKISVNFDLLKEYYRIANPNFVEKLSCILSSLIEASVENNFTDLDSVADNLMVLTKEERACIKNLGKFSFQFMDMFVLGSEEPINEVKVAIWMRNVVRTSKNLDWRRVITFIPCLSAAPFSHRECDIIIQTITSMEIDTSDMFNGKELCEALNISPGRHLETMKDMLYEWKQSNKGASKQQGLDYLRKQNVFKKILE